MSDLFVARQSGTVWIAGRRHAIRSGVTVAQEGSEMLRLHSKLFKPLQVHYPSTAEPRKRGGEVPYPATEQRQRGGPVRRPVEQATAAPGELRNVAPAQTFSCDEPGCDATAKSAQGLAAHKRTHRSDDES